MLQASPPTVGQLAHVRGRRFLTLDVRCESKGNENFHLVRMVSVDDSLGDELSVLWECEPRALALDFDEIPSPTGLDDPEVMDAFLNAVRWGIVNDIDKGNYLSPFRSGIKIEDYQLDPLVRALQTPRTNLLLSDGVGLGKTIEAGLIIQEFIGRNRIQRCLILCPSSLQLQWQEEMRDKFGLEFKIIDSSSLKEIRRNQGINVNPWASFPRLIASYDFLKQEHILRSFQDLLPADGQPTYPRKFGMLVVDECHNITPGRKGTKESQRSHLIKTIAKHFEHKLFLSATPHNGFSESFTSLLELLDPQRYARGLKINKEQLHGTTMVRRLKSDEGLADRFCKRSIEPLYVSYSDAEKQAHALLQQYATVVRQESSDVMVEFVLKTLKKRFFSSPAAFRSTIDVHYKTLTEPKQNDTKRQAVSVLQALIKELEEKEDNLGIDGSESEEQLELAVEQISKTQKVPSHEQLQILRELQGWASRAELVADSRFKVLCDWLSENIKPNGVWNNERVIIFTEARTTQKWLYNQLSQRGFTENGRTQQMYGGMPSEEREEIKKAFLHNPAESKVRILIATDTASEGVNLHTHCNKLIHFDTSWRPTIMEQRNGRVDRHGQSRDVTIFHFAPAHSINTTFNTKSKLEDDLEFLFVAAQKTHQIREDLGKVGPVIADQIAERMLGKRAQLETSLAEQEANVIRKFLKTEIGYAGQIKKLREEFEHTKQSLNLTPKSIKAVVDVALNIAKQLPLIPVEGQPGVYTIPHLTGSWRECLKGLEHPFTKATRNITFDYALAENNDSLVLVHLNHRLVKMSMGLLRAALWERDAKNISRITVKTISKKYLDSPAILVHGRLLVLGKTQRRLHEELLVAGGKTDKDKWIRFKESELKVITDNLESGKGSDRILANLKAKWSVIDPILRRTLNARMTERTETLENRLNQKRDAEKKTISTVLTDLENQLRAALDSPDQLEMDFSHDKIDYSNVLKQRIRQIPHERQRELDNLDEIYSEPTPKLFPVCVTIVIPKEAS